MDLIALLAMGGALALGEELAGAVIAVMLASGRLLEAYAGNRARRELRALLERAPRVVHRYQDGALVSPPLEEVRPGDRLLVKPGEVAPVDGLVRDATAVLDESALTGEAELVERCDGDQVRSGVVNAGSPFDPQATTTAHPGRRRRRLGGIGGGGARPDGTGGRHALPADPSASSATPACGGW